MDEEKKEDDEPAVVEVEELDEKARRKAEKAAKKAAKKAVKETKSSEGGDKPKEEVETDGGNDEDEVLYGAPDDHVWTDTSHAIKESEKNKGDEPDTSVR